MPNSASQFGDVQTPMALGSSTTGTFAQNTAWRTSRGAGSPPSPYSKRTMGTTMKWDDDNSGPSIPKADKGVGRNDG